MRYLDIAVIKYYCSVFIKVVFVSQIHTHTHTHTHTLEITVPAFSGQSYITYAIPPVSSSTNFSITLSFRSSNSSGLLLLAKGTNGSYISLGVKNGLLVFEYKLSSKPVVTVTSAFYSVQDTLWHSVRISLQNGVGMMVIDSQVPFAAPPPTIELPDVLYFTPLYVGGVDNINSIPRSGMNNAGLVGCVDILFINNMQVDLIADALSAKEISQCRMGACSSSTCMNGGVCSEKDEGDDCSCPVGYTGEICEQGTVSCVIDYN